MILASILIVFCATSALCNDADFNNRVALASEKAIDFLKSAKNSDGVYDWRAEETPAAILALISQNKFWHRNRASSDESKFEVATSILKLKKSISDVFVKGGSVKGFDDSFLAQSITALRAICEDPSGDVPNVDLLSILDFRLKKKTKSPSFPGLVLTKCVIGGKMEKGIFENLQITKTDEGYFCDAVCLERASLNIIALNCLMQDKKHKYDQKRLVQLMDANFNFIRNILHSRDAQTLYELALLAQAIEVSAPQTDLISYREIVETLLSYQGQDNSFGGGSVSITAFVVPALTKYTALAVREIECSKTPKKIRDTVKYEIKDKVYNSQSIVGEIHFPDSQLLLEALKDFESRHPEVLQLEVLGGDFGTRITSLVGIRANNRTAWRVFKKLNYPRKSKKEIKDLAAEKIDYDLTYIFEYVRV